MIETNFIHQQLTETETALANRKRQRINLDREIEGLEQILQIYRELAYRPDDRASLRDDALPNARPYGSKRGRIHKAIKDILARDGTCHRSQITEHLKALGLVGNERDPIASVSSILSSSNGMFVTDHRGNWSLPAEAREPGS